MEKLEERLTELEILYSHQAQVLEELNDVVAGCSSQIASLVKENRAMREMLGSLGPEMTESPDE